MISPQHTDSFSNWIVSPGQAVEWAPEGSVPNRKFVQTMEFGAAFAAEFFVEMMGSICLTVSGWARKHDWGRQWHVEQPFCI